MCEIYNDQYKYTICMRTRVPANGLDRAINKSRYCDVLTHTNYKSGKHKGKITKVTCKHNQLFRINRNGIWVSWEKCKYEKRGGKWVGADRWDSTTYSLLRVKVNTETIRSEF